MVSKDLFKHVGINPDDLKHYGVLGMRWGRVRDRNQPGGADGIKEDKKVKTEEGRVPPKKDKRSKLNKKLDSMKRERDWNKVLDDLDKLTTKDIKEVKKRVDLENGLKTLSKSSVATKKDKDDYLNRAKMSNEELSRKVTRLRTKDSLYKSVKSASKEQRELGEKIFNTAKSLSLNLAVSKATKKPINVESVYKSLKDPKESSKKSQEDIQKAILDRLDEK